MVKTFKPNDKCSSVLVGGSDKDGNDKEKERVIALFKKAGFITYSDSDIFQAWPEDPENPNYERDFALLDCLTKADFFYVVASHKGQTDLATAAMLGYATALCRYTSLVSSHELSEERLRVYIDYVSTPEDVIALILED